jgi:hypothetical protein
MPRHVVAWQLHLLHRSTARGEHVIRDISTHMLYLISVLPTDIKSTRAYTEDFIFL